MNSTHRARHYATGQCVQVSWENARIRAVEGDEADPDPGLWIAPGLFDCQVNGFGGIDFQQDELSLQEVTAAVRGLQQAGSTRFLLTLITDDWARLLRRFEHLRALRNESKLLRHAIAGWHIEGPFLSAEPGYRGAHSPGHLADPQPEHVAALNAIRGSDPLLLTMAPERRGAIDAIRRAVSLGIRVSLGHTNASGADLEAAIEAGAGGFTHLGNACPQQLDRHDNILWRVLDQPQLAVSLIPDRLHVSPALFRLIHRARNPQEVFYTTDAMAAAGTSPGIYRLAELRLEVGADGVVRQPGQTNFAGSALRPFDGVLRAAEMLGASWQDVWDGFSVRPARFMGLSASLEAGEAADFCLVQVSEGKAPVLRQVVANGREVAL